MSIKIEHLNYIYGEGTAFEKKALDDINPVSYTHLDVYKRQHGHYTLFTSLHSIPTADYPLSFFFYLQIYTCLLYTSYYDEEGKFIREDKVQHR